MERCSSACRSCMFAHLVPASQPGTTRAASRTVAANSPAIDAVLLQNLQSLEVRAVSTAAMLSDGMRTLRSSIEKLEDHRQLLSEGRCLPVGSVEFMRSAMALAGLEEPEVNPYPTELHPWLRRQVRKGYPADIKGRLFVKPVQLKRFDGFVLDTTSPPPVGDEHWCEQHAAFQALGPTERVWISEPVQFISEWRYYVQAGEFLGQGRYDPDGAENALQPDLQAVRAAIAALGKFEPYALDMGVLADGQFLAALALLLLRAIA